MKRGLPVFVTALCLLLWVSSVFSQETAQYEMRIAIGNPRQEKHFGWTPFEVLKNVVETRSQNRLQITLIPQAMGQSSMNQITMVKDGIIHGHDFAGGHLATIYPPIQVLSIPYLFSTREIAWQVLDGPLGDGLIEDMADKTGLRPLFWLENGGFRHYSNNKHAIRQPADMQGLRIRTMGSPMNMKSVADLGGKAVPIEWGEVYSAIESDVVDGQENSIGTFLIPHFENIQNHIILDGHIYGIYTLLINETWYQKLPDDLKSVLQQSEDIVKNVSRGLSVVNEMEGITYLRSKGVNLYCPSAAEKKMFRDATRDSAVVWLEEKVGKEWVDMALQETAGAEKKLGY